MDALTKAWFMLAEVNVFCTIYSKSCESELQRIELNGKLCLISIFLIKFSFALYVNATNAWAVIYGYYVCDEELHFKRALHFIEYVNRKQITQHKITFSHNTTLTKWHDASASSNIFATENVHILHPVSTLS